MILVPEAFRTLSTLVVTNQSANSPDTLADGIALGAALISLVSLGFTISNEWWRGRRVSVIAGKRRVGNTDVFAIEVKNKGGLPVYVIDWGWVYQAGRGPGRDLRWFEPDGTGINGPALPCSIPGSESIILNTEIGKVKEKVDSGNPKKYMRGYVIIASSTRRRYSNVIRLS